MLLQHESIKKGTFFYNQMIQKAKEKEDEKRAITQKVIQKEREAKKMAFKPFSGKKNCRGQSSAENSVDSSNGMGQTQKLVFGGDSYSNTNGLQDTVGNLHKNKTKAVKNTVKYEHGGIKEL